MSCIPAHTYATTNAWKNRLRAGLILLPSLGVALQMSLGHRREGLPQCPLWYLLWTERLCLRTGAPEPRQQLAECEKHMKFSGGEVPGKEVFFFFFKSFKVGGCSREKLGKSKK